tara:strand:+ start:3873 stop:4103 length:231 start_codon:yes stop_codon:yes gene_type:complete
MYDYESLRNEMIDEFSAFQAQIENDLNHLLCEFESVSKKLHNKLKALKEEIDDIKRANKIKEPDKRDPKKNTFGTG